MKDSPGGQVENHREVAVALADADLIDGNGTQVPQPLDLNRLYGYRVGSWEIAAVVKIIEVDQ